MTVSQDARLVFSKDQIVTSSQVSKNFGEVRREAAQKPLFITGRSGIDTVLISYDEYENMYLELETLREERFQTRVAERLGKPSDRISLEEAMGEKAYERLIETDPDAVPDEDLFE